MPASPLKAILLAATLATVAFAGCLQTAEETPTSTSDPGAAAGPLKTILPEDLLKGTKAYDFLYEFAMGFPLRSSDFPNEIEASRSYLMETLTSYNLSVERHDYSATGSNIIGYHNGTTQANEWIVITAHYDSASNSGNAPLHTIYGAWDDGAGSAALLELARSMSQRDFNRTIVFLFTDEEEQGLLGSQAFVKDYATREDITIVANLNMDPPALNYPCRDPDGTYLPVTVLYDDSAPQQLRILQVMLDASNATGIPEEVRDYHTGGVPIAEVAGTGLSGTSDHASFQEAGIPAVFVGGAVGKKVAIVSALSYGLHTAADTAQQMEARCGGANLLKEGFQVILNLVYDATARLDGIPLVELQAPVVEAEAAAGTNSTRAHGDVMLVGASLKPAPGTDMEAYERIMKLREAGLLNLDLSILG
ncbi:MAG TPA: M20/M25/M40 family metallo-hydrolase [Candidatus Thermoplasmatota archaeon]|nr:M20/M25/M40 family metallo-hydrolase [Candidatus Thermoplasmatota archaeon]